MATYLGKHPRKKQLNKLASLDATYVWNNNGSTFKEGGSLPCTDTKSGINNPLWRRNIEVGLDAGSVYSRSFEWKLSSNTAANFQWTQWSNYPPVVIWRFAITGNYALAQVSKYRHSPVNGAMDLSRSLAKLAFLKKVNAEMSMFSGGVFFGELRRTIRMIKHPLSGIQAVTKRYFSKARKLYLRAKKRARRFKRWRKPYEDESFVNALSSAYLEWTYGMAPLLADMERIGKTVGSIVEKPQSDIRVQVTVPTPEIRPYTRYFVGNRTSAPIGIHLLNRLQGSTRIVGAIRGDIRSSNYASIEKLGLSTNQFIPTVWELIPYSFIVDYLINVGDVLGAAFTATYALRYAWQSERIVQRNEAICVALFGIHGKPRSCNYGMSACAIERFTFNRSRPNLAVSVLDLHFQDVTVRHAVNSAVLGLYKYRTLKDLL